MRARTSLFAICLLGACGGPVALDDGGARVDAARTEPDAGTSGLGALPNDAWSFVRIPGAVCGNGSPAAIGVNPHAGATELLVVIAGGGACWDAATCLGASPTATHIAEDYTEAMLASERAVITGAGWDDRASAASPFREANIVYVPYCTGDIHAGDAERTYDVSRPDRVVHHRGGANMQRYVDAMREAWPDIAVTRVVGFSAGGYGAQMNWGRFADAWPGASLSLLADCAPLAALDAPRYATWRASWNMHTPSDCTACATTFAAYDDYFDARYPASRFGLVATMRDEVLTGFWDVSDFPARVDALLTDHLDDNATTRYFVVDSTAHVVLGDALTLRSADGTLLVDWVGGWLVGDETRWHDTRP